VRLEKPSWRYQRGAVRLGCGLRSLEAMLCPGFTMWPYEPARSLPEGTCWLVLP